LAVLGPALLTVLTHRLGMSPARSGGLISGFVNEGYAGCPFSG
jgi:hypothetical protein